MDAPSWLEGLRFLVEKLEAARVQPENTPFIRVIIERWATAIPAMLAAVSDAELMVALRVADRTREETVVAVLAAELHRRGLDT